MFFDNATYIENERFIQKVMTPRRAAVEDARMKADMETAEAMGMTVEELRKKLSEGASASFFFFSHTKHAGY